MIQGDRRYIDRFSLTLGDEKYVKTPSKVGYAPRGTQNEVVIIDDGVLVN